MRKAFLSLFAVLLFCGCNKTTSDKMCGFIEKATEKIENATTLKEIDDINDKLMQDIAVFSVSLSEEEYNQWNQDAEAQMQIDQAKQEYAAAKKAKTEKLQGK